MKSKVCNTLLIKKKKNTKENKNNKILKNNQNQIKISAKMKPGFFSFNIQNQNKTTTQESTYFSLFCNI